MESQTTGSMGPLAKEVAELMRRYSTLADAILMTQCRLNGCSPGTLKSEELETLIPLLRDAVGRFTSPIKADKLEADLLVLLKSRSGLRESASLCPSSPLGQCSSSPKHDNLADKVLEILGEHTPFAGQIFSAQCKSISVDPVTIRPEDLDELIPRLSARVGQWTSLDKAESVERQLRKLKRTRDTAHEAAENATKASPL